MIVGSPKVLILRFSSFGDVVQALSLASAVRRSWPTAEVHFVTKSEFADLPLNHPHIQKVWSLRKSEGVGGLWRLVRKLQAEQFTHIYDAHNNLRTRLISFFLRSCFWGGKKIAEENFLRKSQFRWKRFQLFVLKKNTFPQPFANQKVLLAPLAAWGLETELPAVPQIFFDDELIRKVRGLLPAWPAEQKIAVFAPSASTELKRWPIEHWKKLVYALTDWKFILLGGPTDDFIEEIRRAAPDQSLNLAGRLSFRESAATVLFAQLVISNDTGIMHVGEQLGVPTIALMGPAPFGFPSRPSTIIKERELPCRPCSSHGQGPCRNLVYQKCLVDIQPEELVFDVRVLAANRVVKP